MQRRTPAILAIVIASLALTACGHKMMRTPQLHRNQLYLDALPPDQQTTRVEILYATDRQRTASDNPQYAYNARRGLTVRLGSATVRLGKESGSWEQLAEDTTSGKRPPIRVESISDFGELWTTYPYTDMENHLAARDSDDPGDLIRAPANHFASLVNDKLGASHNKTVTIYVHGYNSDLSKAVRHMADFQHFMRRGGVFIPFSWPSARSAFGYNKQLARAAVSVRNLREFIIYLAEHTDAEQIDIIGYSAGAPIVNQALLQLALIYQELPADERRAKLKLDDIILASADDDLDYFRSLYLDGVGEIANRITVYTNSRDLGLEASARFLSGTPRLGNAANRLTEVDRIALRVDDVTSFIDVAGGIRFGGGTDIWGHGYWYANPWVSSDLIATLALELAPGERGLVQDPETALWEFPKDYDERINEVISDLMLRQNGSGG